MSLLPVVTDYAGLERAAYELFARATRSADQPTPPPARLAAAALDPARLRDRMDRPQAPPSDAAIPLAYRLWLAHLLWLEEALHTVECRAAELTSVELAGLQAVARARARFLRTHQICPHCDAVNPRWHPARGDSAPRCRRCHQEL